MFARRDVEQFSLSFLDVICCGFGAIILLLMITKTVQPQIIEASTVGLDGRIAELQEQLFELRGETHVLNRDLNAKHEQLSQYDEQIARLRNTLATIQSRHDALNTEVNASNAAARELIVAQQRLSEEMKRLLGTQHQSRNQLIGGIPVDSEYIIFVIDTSTSMLQYSWGRMMFEFENVLRIYPGVKGIQVMNDMGQYMLPRYRGKWIPDTPRRRKAIMSRLRTWRPFSNSSPVEGIVEAVKTFYAPNKKISIYVFGDDFQGQSIERVVTTIDKINRADAKGNRRVRIHAVGFPALLTQPIQAQTTVTRFATLMREVTHRNGGTFVGLNDYR